MVGFGDFKPLCEQTPSYPWCNIFYRQVRSSPQNPTKNRLTQTRLALQLEKHSPKSLTGFSANATSAPVGINPECGALKAGVDGSLGNIANMIACGLSMSIVATLIIITTRRRAAVGAFLSVPLVCQPPEHSTCPLPGRSEFRIFLIMYFISLPFQLLTTGAVLQQGSTALVALTALHAGVVAGLFWALLGNAIVSTQVVEDGTLSSLIVRPPSALHSPSTRRVAHCS